MLTLTQRTEAESCSSSPSLSRTGSSKQRCGRTQTWANFTTGYRSSATLVAIHTNSRTYSSGIGRTSSTTPRSCWRRKSSWKRRRKAPRSSQRTDPWKFNRARAKRTNRLRSLRPRFRCQDLHSRRYYNHHRRRALIRILEIVSSVSNHHRRHNLLIRAIYFSRVILTRINIRQCSHRTCRVWTQAWHR